MYLCVQFLQRFWKCLVSRTWASSQYVHQRTYWQILLILPLVQQPCLYYSYFQKSSREPGRLLPEICTEAFRCAYNTVFYFHPPSNIVHILCYP
jgi:hypothetical protein